LLSERRERLQRVTVPEPSHDTDLIAEVTNWLDSGIPAPEVERRICAKGFTTEDAANIVDTVVGKQMSDAAAAGRRQNRLTLAGGVVLCALGTVFVVLGIIELDRYGIGLLVGGISGVAAGLGVIFHSLA
jgi:hypothetical protein